MYHWYLPYVPVGKNLISSHSCLHFFIPGISKQYVFVEAMKNTTRDATIRQYVFRSAYTGQSEMVHTTSTWAPKKNQRIHEYVPFVHSLFDLLTSRAHYSPQNRTTPRSAKILHLLICSSPSWWQLKWWVHIKKQPYPAIYEVTRVLFKLSWIPLNFSNSLTFRVRERRCPGSY